MRTCPDCQNSYEDEVLHCPEDGLDLAHIEPVDELIGRTVGSYRIVRPLGKGGMGAVYLGEHPVIGSRVAMKFLHPQFATDSKIVDRFFNEARAVNLIGHDNILKILDLNVTDDNRHYFVMEFLHGKALQSLVKPNKPVPLDVAGSILLQCCAALQAAHDKGIIHRDLKPDNIYLIHHNGRKNFVKVVDFGIAKLTGESGQAGMQKTQTGMVMGTPAYMSPEQGAGEASKIDATSDVYSLGVMMYQMATGKLPFPGSNFGEVLMGHLQRPPPPPRSIVPEIPEQYEAIILHCLEKNQDDRYQSMAELASAIRGVMGELGLSTELPEADADTSIDLPPLAFGTPSNPGVRTPSRPGTNPNRASQPPRQISSPRGSAPAGLRNSSPNRGPPARPRSQPPQQPLHAAEPSGAGKRPLIAGVAAVALLLLGGGFYYLRAQEAEAQATQLAAKATAAAKALAAQQSADAKVAFQVISDPAGADIDASWRGGSKSGGSPLSLEVPRGVKVRLDFSKADCTPYTMEVNADSTDPLTARLTCHAPRPAEEAQAAPVAALAESGLVPPAVPGGPQRHKHAAEEKPEKKNVPAQKDGLIDLGDAFGK